MKRMFILCLCLILLPACGRESTTEPLSYVRMPMRVSARLVTGEAEGSVLITFTDATHYTVEYTEPPVMGGVVYERAGERSYLTFGESRVEISEGDVCLAALAAAKVLVPDVGALTADVPDTVDGQSVRLNKYHTDTLTAVHYVSQDGALIKAEGDCDGYSAVFTQISFSY